MGLSWRSQKCLMKSKGKNMPRPEKKYGNRKRELSRIQEHSLPLSSQFIFYFFPICSLPAAWPFLPLDPYGRDDHTMSPHFYIFSIQSRPQNETGNSLVPIPGSLERKIWLAQFGWSPIRGGDHMVKTRPSENPPHRGWGLRGSL